MNIVENNKLLGMFLNNRHLIKDLSIPGGYAWNGRFLAPAHVISVLPDTEYVVYSPSMLRFHESWDWLMPVVRKCVEVALEENSEMFLTDEYTSLLDVVPLADIESAYRVVVEFVKKYNSI